MSEVPAGTIDWDRLASQIMGTQEQLDLALSHVAHATDLLLDTDEEKALFVARSCAEVQDLLEDAGARLTDVELDHLSAEEHLAAAARRLDALDQAARPVLLPPARAELEVVRASLIES